MYRLYVVYAFHFQLTFQVNAIFGKQFPLLEHRHQGYIVQPNLPPKPLKINS